MATDRQVSVPSQARSEGPLRQRNGPLVSRTGHGAEARHPALVWQDRLGNRATAHLLGSLQTSTTGPKLRTPPGSPIVQRQSRSDEPDEEEQRTSGLSCPLADFTAAGFDESRSCCHSAALGRARDHLATSREYLQRAIQQMAGGARMDGVIRAHFGAGALAERSTILANLRTTLQAAERFDSASTSHTFACRPLGHSDCQSTEHARAGRDTNIVLCVNEWWLQNDPWTTVLHELFHYSGVALLPVLGETATPEDVASGRFETYYSPAGEEARHRDPSEIASMESEDPSSRQFTRYPTAHSLQNADSYAQLVATVGAEGWTEEGESPWHYVPMPSVFFGSTLPSGEFTVAARLALTPFGQGLHFITPGAIGIWTPGRGAVPLTDPAEGETTGYLGGELGIRGAFGSTVAAVFDVAGGGGARWTRGGDVEGAMHLRTSAGVRFGTPSIGGSVNADLTRMFVFGRENRIDDGWILGGSLGLHFGGHSGAGR